jgi:hypothetical protein
MAMAKSDQGKQPLPEEQPSEAEALEETPSQPEEDKKSKDDEDYETQPPDKPPHP